MPRRKTPPAAAAGATLQKDLVEKLIPDPMDAAGIEAMFQKLKKAVIERASGAELGVHLAKPEGAQGKRATAAAARRCPLTKARREVRFRATGPAASSHSRSRSTAHGEAACICSPDGVSR